MIIFNKLAAIIDKREDIEDSIVEVGKQGCWVRVDGLTDDDHVADDGSTIAFPWRSVQVAPQQAAEVE